MHHDQIMESYTPLNNYISNCVIKLHGLKGTKANPGVKVCIKGSGSSGNFQSKLDVETPVEVKPKRNIRPKMRERLQKLKSIILSKGGSHVGTTFVPR